VDSRAGLTGLLTDLSIDWKGDSLGIERALGEAKSRRQMERLRIEVTDGTEEWLTGAEVDAVCDVLWSSAEKGALSIIGKVADERRRPRVLQHGVRLTESEFQIFRRALDDARRVTERS
jgi:hypothetical protein